MANEFRAALQITHTPSVTNVAGVGKIDVLSIIDTAGAEYVHGIQEAAITTGVLLAELASVGTPGMVYVRNLSVTAGEDINIGNADDSYTISLQPGEFAVFRAAAALYIESATGTPDLEYVIWEE